MTDLKIDRINSVSLEAAMSDGSKAIIRFTNIIDDEEHMPCIEISSGDKLHINCEIGTAHESNHITIKFDTMPYNFITLEEADD